MVAALDIGNTNTKIKIFSDTPPDYSFLDFNFNKSTPFFCLEDLKSIPLVKAFVVSSVVDNLNPLLIKEAQKRNIPCYFINQEIKVGIDFSFYQSAMGPDRVSSALGALSQYPLPFCVVDMGTATTFSVVNNQGVYKGGFILPGVKTMLKSLSAFTHRLPELDLTTTPQTFLGLNTQENILNGVYYFAQEGLKGILNTLLNTYPSLTIIGSGGVGKLFKEHFNFYDSILIFKGLRKAYNAYFKVGELVKC